MINVVNYLSMGFESMFPREFFLYGAIKYVLGYIFKNFDIKNGFQYLFFIHNDKF